MADLVWLHEDALRRTHPVFTAAAGNARVVYVWDNSYLDATLIGQTRRMFIYETLAELDLDVVFESMVEALLQRPSLLRGAGLRKSEACCN